MTVAEAAEIVGAEHALAGDEAPSHTVVGVTAPVVAFPGTREQATALVNQVAAAGGSLTVFGGGTQMDMGNAPTRLDLVLVTTRLTHVVDYQPDDMTITVEPGLTLANLQQLLATRGQFLPLDPPLGDRATVGGTVAAAATGAWRAGFGSPRDWLIGCRVVGADGSEVRAGGQVVKNVAGYDLPKLYTGSFGTLGLITELTFKVMPMPPARGACSVYCPTPEALGDITAQVLASDLQPTALEAQFAEDGPAGTWSLTAEFRHVEEAVEWQVGQFRRLATEAGCDSERLHEELADARLRRAVELAATEPFAVRLGGSTARFTNLAAGAVEVLRRHQLPPRVGGHAAQGMAYGVAGDATPEVAADLRSLAADHMALCVFPRLTAGLRGIVEPWADVGPEIALMRGLKQRLDPGNVFSPGRFVGGI